MLITKFNKLIRNKFVWTALAVIIGLVFLLSGGVGGARGCQNQEDRTPGNEAGTLDGDPVTRRQYLLARMFELSFRSLPDISLEAEKTIHRRVWQRLAALKTAESMGLGATDDELRNTLRSDPSFAVDGVFSRDRYRQLIRNQLRIPEQTFEDYLRQDITLRKLRDAVGAFSWTSPSEVTRRLHDLTDSFEVQYIKLAASNHQEEVTVTDEDVAAFYDEHKEMFALPEQRQVRYVVYPIVDQTNATDFTDDDIIDYYDENMDDFVPASATNEVPEPLPLEDVRDEILTALARRDAEYAAMDRATDFVMDLATGGGGGALSFERATERRGLTVNTTELFSAGAWIPGIDAGNEFSRVAFELDLKERDPDRYFSDAVLGASNVYVMALLDIRDPRTPPLEEIAEEVRDAAVAMAEREAFDAYAQNVRKEIATDMEADTSFMDAAGQLGFNVQTTGTFSAYAVTGEEFDNVGDVLVEVVDMVSGDLSEAVPTATGALIVHVVRREAGEPIAMELMKPQVAAMLNRYRSPVLYDAWLEHNLEQYEFEDHSPPRNPDDE